MKSAVLSGLTSHVALLEQRIDQLRAENARLKAALAQSGPRPTVVAATHLDRALSA